MKNYRTTLKQGADSFDTLQDILPEHIKILFIAKTPALKSVEIGHYFQGHQGKMLWNKLVEFNLLTLHSNEYEDEALERHNYGIMDIVKRPRNYNNEPTVEEYRKGTTRIIEIINTYKPKIIFFVYKKVLDSILMHHFNRNTKSKYGFNHDLDSLFSSKVFVFPMPGTPCKKEDASKYMGEMKHFVEKLI